MKALLFICALAAFSCKGPKAATVQEQPASEGSKGVSDSLPVCVRALIEKFKSEDVTNPPMSITRYKYNGKYVYLTSAPCCDNFNDLYNDSCRLIGHPSGGFTGRGDGKFPNFSKEATEEKILWVDPRGK